MRKQKEKAIQYNIKKIVEQEVLADVEFSQIRKVISILMYIWIASRVILCGIEIMVLLELANETKEAFEGIGATVMVVIFAMALKNGNRRIAILPIVGGIFSFIILPIGSIVLLLNHEILYIKIYAWSFVFGMAYQIICMSYILFSTKSKAYDKKMTNIKVQAKGLSL
ncbi:hypothetical protein [Cellulosilyticum lentocellum]|uniref:Uncharacterized protein n=1 Tax=Cellulosilyticum lentocellum (strain ATCC 49066 / DSM 5427 / NCIMB 11756 / RHM5) TaxID=642492 RepID=F2JGZ1_CELLD|nr:hypothetical protein [Cellulosilyticum lentocellum]ADZ85331.1 hypothetical protein Clole_3648 [Cellulosilyticum lentocellum DSM 5427]